MTSLAELVEARAGDAGGGLRFEDRSWTWAEVVAESRRRAGVLAGLRRDGPFHVGVLLDNLPEYLWILFGAALAGATVVGINPTRRGAELARDIAHTDCQLILTDSTQIGLLEGLDTGVEPGRTLTVDGRAWSDRLAGAGTGEAEGELSGPASLWLLIFTSGSTGAPKAVKMTQGRAARSAAATRFSARDVLYCPMPLFHGNALAACVLPALASGSTLVLRRRFSASGFLPDVRRYGATFTSTVGRALAHILATPATPEDRDHRLRYVLAPESSEADKAAFTARFGVPVVEGYGSSENAVVIMPFPGTPPGALGKPAPGLDVAVVDPATGEPCPPANFDDAGLLLNADEAIGEIVGRNAGAHFEGYWRNPEAEAERTRGGWYWSGDLGYRDTEGWFYFAGRSGEWMRVDSENFATAPVERILARAPGIAGVAVYPVPDIRTGDQVMAAVELPPGATFDPEAWAAFLASSPDLGTKWAPRYVRVVPRLPVTPTGKVDKKPLRGEGFLAGEVWWRPAAGEPYRRLTGEDRDRIRQEFDTNRRSHLLAAATGASELAGGPS